MSVENSVTKGGREIKATDEPSGFQMPAELASKYEIRVIEPTDGGERRIGMFLPTDREDPSIEIDQNGERIIARNEDPETVAALVTIARHNGWEEIDVKGSPEFRKAVWTAGTRNGLTVRGYEPTFEEQERMEALLREDAARRERETRDQPAQAVEQASTPEQAAPDRSVEAGDATIPIRSADADREPGMQAQPVGSGSAELSEGDRKLLLTVRAYTQDRKLLSESLAPSRDPVENAILYERLDVNKEALNGALDRALESPTLDNAFERAGYSPGEPRQKGQDGEWDTEIANAIYVVRSGLHREVLDVEPNPELDELKAAVENRLVAESTVAPERQPEPEPVIVREKRQHDGAERDHQSEELAELFLHGGAEQIEAEPRLAGAREAQAAMEEHIAEVFDGDVDQMTAANLESRQMISDVLRRGLDVSVREPTPVRPIEPVEPSHDLER